MYKKIPTEVQQTISVRWMIKPKIIDVKHGTKAKLY